MSNLPTRRGFLAAAGTGATASLAGCSQLESVLQDGSGNADDAVTVTVQPDQEQLATLEQELRRSVENGNITEQEAGQQFQEKQRELTEEAGVPLEELADDNGDVSIEDSSPSYGFYLVDAPAETIVTALQNGDVSAIYPGSQYEQFARRQAQLEQQRAAMDGQQGADGASNESNESTTDGDTNESTADNDTTNSSTNDTNDSD